MFGRPYTLPNKLFQRRGNGLFSCDRLHVATLGKRVPTTASGLRRPAPRFDPRPRRRGRRTSGKNVVSCKLFRSTPPAKGGDRVCPRPWRYDRARRACENTENACPPLSLQRATKVSVDLGQGSLNAPIVSNNPIQLKFRTKDFTGEYFHYAGDMFLIYKSGHLARLSCKPKG